MFLVRILLLLGMMISLASATVIGKENLADASVNIQIETWFSHGILDKSGACWRSVENDIKEVKAVTINLTSQGGPLRRTLEAKICHQLISGSAMLGKFKSKLGDFSVVADLYYEDWCDESFRKVRFRFGKNLEDGEDSFITTQNETKTTPGAPHQMVQGTLLIDQDCGPEFHYRIFSGSAWSRNLRDRK